jgi:hypothetical protein
MPGWRALRTVTASLVDFRGRAETHSVIYLRVYRTERNERNGHELRWREKVEATPVERPQPLSHPGGRRFESG